eukprot:TRINITY_DN13283_c0_g1_i7.p1 TRINITY_DN13283_c0_g1~~TRINITY_DN13283_c0_g1_i7.p1  ORF type:complete len:528 (+),score=103.60 TRINITY_DN13283_c0_g1_i7:64-1584(+)
MVSAVKQYNEGDDSGQKGGLIADASNVDTFADASSALGSALICISKCEALLKKANEEKMLVPVFCQIQTIKDNIGSLMEELTKAVTKSGGEEDTIKDFDIDEYVVKTEVPEQESEDEYEPDYSLPEDPDFNIKEEKVSSAKQSNKKKLICDNCDMKFSCIEDLEDHQLACESKGSFSCHLCDKEFPNDKRLNRHIKMKHKEIKCEECGESFDSKADLKEHKNFTKHSTTTTQQNHKIMCEKCDKFFLSNQTYQRHVLQFHSKNHVCSVCNEAFDVMKDLKSHMKTQHDLKLRNYSCGTCREIFHDVPSLQLHINETNHKSESNCNICGKVFHHESYLQRHIEIRHSQKLKCEECGESLASKSDLRKHKNEVHNRLKEKICTICGASVVAGSYFRHMSYHGEKKFHCEMCGKSFYIKHKLDEHMRTHTGETPFGCEICGKAFTASRILSRHRVIHTGERPHECVLCGKSFNQKSNLKTHMKSHANGMLKNFDMKLKKENSAALAPFL